MARPPHNSGWYEKAARQGVETAEKRLLEISSSAATTLKAETWTRAKAQYPPLISAIEKGDVVEVKRLLDSGVGPNTRVGTAGMPALWFAADRARPDMAKLLLDRGANVDGTPDAPTETPLMRAIQNMHPHSTRSEACREIVQLLVARGADVNLADDHVGSTALKMAAYNGDVDVVQLLLDNGAEINYINKEGGAALFCFR